MKRLIVALAAGIALWSCGGSGGSGSGLNPAFTGAWNGTTTVTLQGFAPYSYSAHVNIAVSGSTGNITQVCTDGSGSISFQGSGSSAQWTGTATCPPVAVPGICSAVTLTYQSGSLTLNTANTLTAQGTGMASGCGTSRPATLTFVGSK